VLIPLANPPVAVIIPVDIETPVPTLIGPLVNVETPVTCNVVTFAIPPLTVVEIPA